MIFVSRAQWSARPHRGYTSRTAAQVTNVVVHHGESARPAHHDLCASVVRGYQSYHLDGQGWVDIGYHRIVCPHAYVFEGRPLLAVAAAAPSHNTSGFHVCFIDGGNDPPTTDAGRAVVEVIALAAIELGAFEAHHCHRDVTSTSCPGDGKCAWVHDGMPVDGLPHPDPGPRRRSNAYALVMA